jgi:pimeloyl-ACP methyl ester carboxylesterase
MRAWCEVRGGLLAALLWLLPCMGCAIAPPPLGPVSLPAPVAQAEVGLPGTLIAIEPLRRLSPAEAHLALWLADIEDVSPRAAADCYRVRYWSARHDGQPVAASGLLAVPSHGPVRGLVSYQHGVATEHRDVPSALRIEGTLAAILFASGGYAVLAPDYQGLGASPGTHPFLHAASEANDVRYLLDATRSQLPPGLPLVLAGFSQGGHATLAALRALEQDAGVSVAGAIIVAGALNIRTSGLERALSGTAPNAVVYLAYMVMGYAQVHGQPLASVLDAAVIERVRAAIDGHHDSARILAALPAEPRALFSPAFLAAWDGGGQHWLLDALRDNEVTHWRPRTPVLLLYGDEDRVVPPAEALAAAAELRSRGAFADAMSVGAVGHEDSVRRAIPVLLRWLRSRMQGADDRAGEPGDAAVR